jgi:hypothetical protein
VSDTIKKMRRAAGAAVWALAIMIPPSISFADDGAFPIVWGGTYTVGVQTDRTLKNSGGVSPFTNAYSEPEVDWYANFGKYLSVNGLFKMEQVRDRSSSGAFEDEGAWIDHLYATLSAGPFKVYGGKIHPTFGLAWDATPGLYGTDMAEDYELTEKIGVGVAAELHQFGEHTFAFEAFRADTSFLSKSYFTKPKTTDATASRFWRTRHGDGGVSNTRALGNYAITLEGKDIPGLKGFSYMVGGARQNGSDVLDELDERSVAAGFQWEIPITSRMTATPIFEWAKVWNQGGADTDATYYTAGLGVEFGNFWSLALYGTIKPVTDNATPDSFTDRSYGASIGYDLSGLLKKQWRLFDGLGVEAGFKKDVISRDNQTTVGFAVTYERAF